MERVTLENLKKSQEKPSAVWTQYTRDCNKNSNQYFVFYEGKDRHYYNYRINMYTDEYETYETGGKNSVKEVYTKIIKTEGEGSLQNKLFFIDKDYDNEGLHYDDNFYVTQKYSIENYYVNHSTMEKILKNYFGLRSTDEKYSLIMGDFDNRYNEFITILTDLNLWAIACKLEGVKIDFNLLKLKKNPSIFISVSHEDVGKKVSEELNFKYFDKQYISVLESIRTKGDNQESNYIKYSDKRDSIKECFDNKLELYRANIEKYFRGKFIIWFLNMFLNSITKRSSEIIIKEVEFSKSDLEIMSLFTIYAETPVELEDYLKRKIN